MKLLLIYVLSEKDDPYMPPLGLGYIASYLFKNYNKKIDIKIIQKDCKKTILEYKPDIVGVSSISKNYDIAKEIAKFCNEKNIFNIIGGVHITCLPESFNKNMDIGIIGEGEKTFLEIIENIELTEKQDGRRTVILDKNKLNEIKGIIYWDNGKIINNGSREPVGDLDTIPPPARNLLDIRPDKPIPLFTTRGCPFNCRFCANIIMNSRRLRMFSVDYVIKEMKDIIKNYSPDYIKIWDDTFIVNKDRLKKIANAIIENGIHQKVKFVISARADLIDDDIAKILKEINTHEVGFGFESGSDDVLKYLKCGIVTVKDNRRAIKIMKKYGIKVSGFFIIGVPNDTRETILQTLNFIKKNPIYTANVFILTPYPRTEIWDYALKKGLVSNDMDWSILDRDIGIDKPDNAIYLCENLSKKEFSKLCKKFIINDKIMKIKQMLLNALNSPEKILPYIYRAITKNIIKSHEDTKI